MKVALTSEQHYVRAYCGVEMNSTYPRYRHYVKVDRQFHTVLSPPGKRAH